MRLSQLVSEPEFGQFEILAGDINSQCEISSVNVIDAPDSYLYFKGGEFLLTNAYILKDDVQMFKNFVENCHARGVAAIGIKLHRFIDVLPPEVAELCNKLGFPIVSVPLHFAFADIINPVLTSIVNQQVMQLQFSEKIHNSFTELALKGGDCQQIIHTLSGILHKDIRYYDTYFDKLFVSNTSEKAICIAAEESLKQVLLKNKPYKLEADKRNYGYLVVMDGGGLEDNKAQAVVEAFEEIAVEHACTVLKLNIQKEISNQQIESKYRAEFVQGLILNSFASLEQINDRAALYGWRFQHGLTAIIISLGKEAFDEIDDLAKNYEIYRFAIDYIKGQFPAAIYSNFGENMIILVSPGLTDLQVFYKTLIGCCQSLAKAAAANYSDDLFFGIGSYKTDLTEVHQSYEEAQKALKIAGTINKQVAFYEDLGLYKLLAPMSNSVAAKEFCDLYVNQLVAYDNKHQTDYLQTVKVLVECHWNLKLAAQKLFVHYNTIKNRYNRVGDILQTDLHDDEMRMNITIALKIIALGEKK